jgi:hypothetical protein
MALLKEHPGAPPQEAEQNARDYFIDFSDGSLMPEYRRNGFGEWAFNLTKGGARTAYFLHTTSSDEADTAAHYVYSLTNSHGCIHIRPSDRARLMALSCLRQGVQLEVKGYEEKGPPPGWGTTVLEGSPRACFEVQPAVPEEKSHPHRTKPIDPGDGALFHRSPQ